MSFHRSDRLSIACWVALAMLAAPGLALGEDRPSVAATQGLADDGQAAGIETGMGGAFLKPMSRLSAILGSVHFLRRLCGDESASVWRDKMTALLAAQSLRPEDEKVLIAAFNGGYSAYEATYRTCTPAARLAVSRYQDEGAALARDIAARYGN